MKSDSPLQPPASREDLPAGWQWVRLGEVCDFLDSRRVPVNNAERQKRIQNKNDFALYPYYGANGQVGWIDDYIFDEPLILLAEDGGFFGSSDKPIAYGIKGRCWVNNHAPVLRPRSCIDYNFCLHAIRLRPDVGRLVSGSTRQKLGQEVAANITLPLPPLPEQKRIASALTAHMADIEQARACVEAQLQAARELPAALLREVFDGPEAQMWPRRRLGELLELRKDVVHPRDNPKGGALFVGLEHILSGTGIRIGGIDVEMADLTGRKPRFYAGDIVYGYLRPYLNKVWVAEFNGLCSVDQYVYRVRQDMAATDFVAWFMRSPAYLNRAPIDATPGQLPRIRTEEVASVEINLPSLPGQQRVMEALSARLAAAELLRKHLQDQMDAINEMPAALLREAFAGRLIPHEVGPQA